MVTVDTFLFIEDPPEIFKCPQCMKVMLEPVTIKCGHSFCKACSKLLDKCTKDGKKNDKKLYFPNIVLENQIKELVVHCGFGVAINSISNKVELDPSGCPEKISLGNKIQHEADCPYRMITCHCGHKLREKELSSHRKSCKSNKTSRDAFIPIERVSSDQKVSTKSPGQSTENILNEVQKVSDNLTIRMRRFETQMNASLQRMENMHAEIHSMITCLVTHFKITLPIETKSHSSSASNQDYSTSQMRQSPKLVPIFNEYMKKMTEPGNFGLSTNKSRWICPFQFLDVGVLRGHKSAITCMAYTKSLLITGFQNHIIRIWDISVFIRGEFGRILQNGGCIGVLEGHTNAISSLCVNDYANELISFDKLTIKIWSLSLYNLLREMPIENPELITCIEISKHFLFIASTHHQISIYRLCNLQFVSSISSQSEMSINNMAVDRSCQTHLYCTQHSLVQIWQILHQPQHKQLALATGSSNDDIDDEEINLVLENTIEYPFYSVCSMVISSLYIIIGTYNRNIQLFNKNNGEYVFSLAGHISSVNAMAITNNEAHLVSVGAEGYINIWELERRTLIQSIKVTTDICCSGVVIKDFIIFVSSSNGEIKLFKYDKIY